ncbi:hypothetical protein DSO57_1031681 [Entomophthora muscae]|uniref:Uncharacterized protein n=1 Tax=Entomophthora muscae TaxID=34485 RepID=A0ACC2SQ28_9FUNG|nr:hypothetical protein DSO57_1031681 [Entomophthora muscae]
MLLRKSSCALIGPTAHCASIDSFYAETGGVSRWMPAEAGVTATPFPLTLEILFTHRQPSETAMEGRESRNVRLHITAHH